MKLRFLSTGPLMACAIGLLGHGQRALARPVYGSSCISCHSSQGFGNSVPNAVFDVIGTSQSTIPNGQFGDPDRGEGPLATYSATPGGTFQLMIQIKDTAEYDPPFEMSRWALGLKRPYTTDPDFHLGNTDVMTWRQDQLLLENHLIGPDYGTPDPAPIPTSSSMWSLYTEGDDTQYYASTGYGGHMFIEPFIMSLTVTVPAGVLPGWYDIELSAAGWDYNEFFAFYDEEHFYLNVVPEPMSLLPALAGLLLIARDARRRRAGSHRS